MAHQTGSPDQTSEELWEQSREKPSPELTVTQRWVQLNKHTSLTARSLYSTHSPRTWRERALDTHNNEHTHLGLAAERVRGHTILQSGAQTKTYKSAALQTHKSSTSSSSWLSCLLLPAATRPRLRRSSAFGSSVSGSSPPRKTSHLSLKTERRLIHWTTVCASEMMHRRINNTWTQASWVGLNWILQVKFRFLCAFFSSSVRTGVTRLFRELLISHVQHQLLYNTLTYIYIYTCLYIIFM